MHNRSLNLDGANWIFNPVGVFISELPTGGYKSTGIGIEIAERTLKDLLPKIAIALRDRKPD